MRGVPGAAALWCSTSSLVCADATARAYMTLALKARGAAQQSSLRGRACWKREGLGSRGRVCDRGCEAGRARIAERETANCGSAGDYVSGTVLLEECSGQIGRRLMRLKSTAFWCFSGTMSGTPAH